MPRDRREPARRDEEQGLGESVGQDLEAGRRDPGPGAEADAHEDVADLRHGGPGQHALDVGLADGPHRAEDHPRKAEDEDGVTHAQGAHGVQREDPDIQQDQQHRVALDHKAREHGARRGGGAAVRVGQPAVEGEHGALDAESRRHQAEAEGEDPASLPRRRELCHRRGELGHQQVSGHGVEQHEAEQEHARAQQAQKQIAHRGDQRRAGVLHHHERAGGDGADLDKHVGGEDVVGVGQNEQARQNHAQHHAGEACLFFIHIREEIRPPAEQTQAHHERKHEAEQALQRPAPDLVAEGARKTSEARAHAAATPKLTPQASFARGPRDSRIAAIMHRKMHRKGRFQTKGTLTPPFSSSLPGACAGPWSRRRRTRAGSAPARRPTR